MKTKIVLQSHHDVSKVEWYIKEHNLVENIDYTYTRVKMSQSVYTFKDTYMGDEISSSSIRTDY